MIAIGAAERSVLTKHSTAEAIAAYLRDNSNLCTWYDPEAEMSCGIEISVEPEPHASSIVCKVQKWIDDDATNRRKENLLAAAQEGVLKAVRAINGLIELCDQHNTMTSILLRNPYSSLSRKFHDVQIDLDQHKHTVSLTREILNAVNDKVEEELRAIRAEMESIRRRLWALEDRNE